MHLWALPRPKVMVSVWHPSPSSSPSLMRRLFSWGFRKSWTSVCQFTDFGKKKILLDKIKVAGTNNKKLLSKLFCSMSSLNPKMSLWNAHENARHAEICAEMACSMAGWDLRFGLCKAVPSCPPKVAASPSCLHEALIWGLEALHSLTFSGWTPHMVSHKACHGALHIWKLGYSSPRPARLSPSIGVEGRNPVHVGRNIHHPYQAMRHHHVSRSQNFQILRTGIQIHSRKGHCRCWWSPRFRRHRIFDPCPACKPSQAFMLANAAVSKCLLNGHATSCRVMPNNSAVTCISVASYCFWCN